MRQFVNNTWLTYYEITRAEYDAIMAAENPQEV